GGALVVVRDDAVELAGALTALGHEPLGRQAMLMALIAPEHPVVRHLIQEVVLERVLARSLEGAGLLRADQVTAPQALEGLSRSGGVIWHGLAQDHVADHARERERSFLRGWQSVEASLQHAGKR